MYGQQTGADKLVFLYDANGSVYGFTYNGASYYYHRNIQGDVLGIYDSTGTELVTYSYDAWGLPTGMTDTSTNGIGTINPIRYRGYLYDAELGFYWLTTRFYDPEIGRFINADGMIAGVSDSVLGYNLYAYCFDNPVNLQDSTGQWPSWLKKAVAAVAVVAVVATVAAVTVATAGAGTAIAAVAVGAAKGAAIGLATGAATGAVAGAVSHRVRTGSWDGAEQAALEGAADGALSGAISGAVTGGIKGGISYQPSTTTQVTTGRGTQNPKVMAAVRKGQAMHKQMDYGPGVVKEKMIAPGCRVDGIDFDNHIIYELKPNNPRAIARGMKQLDRYIDAAKQQFGGEWAGVLKLYE